VMCKKTCRLKHDCVSLIEIDMHIMIFTRILLLSATYIYIIIYLFIYIISMSTSTSTSRSISISYHIIAYHIIYTHRNSYVDMHHVSMWCAKNTGVPLWRFRRYPRGPPDVTKHLLVGDLAIGPFTDVNLM
jgi:hypothetical protein